MKYLIHLTAIIVCISFSTYQVNALAPISITEIHVGIFEEQSHSLFSTDDLIKMAEEEMLKNDIVDINWKLFNEIVNELRERKDVQIAVIAEKKLQLTKLPTKIDLFVEKYEPGWGDDVGKFLNRYFSLSWDMKEYRPLWHAIDSIGQHVKGGIALVTIQDISVGNGKSSVRKVKVSDNGPGFKNIKIKYAIKFRHGRIRGKGLTHAAGKPDRTIIKIPGTTATIRNSKFKMCLMAVFDNLSFDGRHMYPKIIARKKNSKKQGTSIAQFYFKGSPRLFNWSRAEMKHILRSEIVKPTIQVPQPNNILSRSL